MNRKKIDLNTFREKYLLENLTISECADFFGCGKTTIVRFAKSNNIKKPRKLINQNNSKASRKLDYKLIKKLYVEENKTKKEIASIMKVKLGAIGKAISILGLVKTDCQKNQLKYRVNISKKELEKLYLEENKSLSELCDVLSVGETAILGALKRYGIKKPRHLRKELVLKSRILNGNANTIDDKSTLEVSENIGLSVTCINKFIKENNDLTDGEKLRKLKEISTTCTTTLESFFSSKSGLEFFNKKIKTGYKPDFKITNDVYLNVDGLYWHSNKIQKNNRYHFNMRKAYEESGLRILQFREDEVKNKIDIVLSMINNTRNKNISTIYARKCSIKKIEQKEASIFLNKNHLMGSTFANHIGLYYNDSLVSILSYRRYNSKVKIERFCSKTNTRVIGGFSKLLKRLEKTITFERIEYWVDLRYGTGTYLENLGFTHSHDTLGWKWTDFKNTYNRMKCRAGNGKTEKERAETMNFHRIYDAGQRLYVRKYNV